MQFSVVGTSPADYPPPPVICHRYGRGSMCDTLCAALGDRTLFAKNSDRDGSEVQLVESHGARAAGGRLRTQYLELDDAGAHPVLGSRPDWLWGFEHGVNDRRVAMGNEELYTVADRAAEAPALTGLDLVRLALERADSADAALELIGELLAEHGQGGIANTDPRAYFSSFIVADPHRSWVIETCGEQWVARPVDGGAAISNRISLRTDWTRSSPDVAPDFDVDEWRDLDSPTGQADDRLAVTSATATRAPSELDPRAFVAALRDHGGEPWGAPGGTGPVTPPPERAVTVCMHLGGFRATTSSIVADLPADPAEPLRAWVASGSPCCAIYVPVFPTAAVPGALGEAQTWRRFRALREHVEARPDDLAVIRQRFDPVEAELWDEADELGDDPARHRAFVDGAWCRVDDALKGVEAILPTPGAAEETPQSGGGPR